MKAGYREKEVGLQGQEEPAGVDTEWSRPLFLHSAELLRAPLSSPTPPLLFLYPASPQQEGSSLSAWFSTCLLKGVFPTAVACSRVQAL